MENHNQSGINNNKEKMNLKHYTLLAIKQIKMKHYTLLAIIGSSIHAFIWAYRACVTAELIEVSYDDSVSTFTTLNMLSVLGWILIVLFFVGLYKKQK